MKMARANFRPTSHRWFSTERCCKNMFEARLDQASLLKKIIEALKDLVTDANWDVNENGITLQAMVSARVPGVRGVAHAAPGLVACQSRGSAAARGRL